MKNMTSTCIIELSELEVRELTILAINLSTSPSKSPELFCCQSKQLLEKIPQRIKKILLNFKKYGSETGFILMKNFSIYENIIPQLLNNNSSVGETTILARIQAILISVLGELIYYEAEGNGKLFQDIVPVKSMEFVQTSSSSNMDLEIHTEQAFSNLRPDILSLACLRGDTNALTFILPLEKIIQSLTEKELTLLQEPLWEIGIDLSFKINGLSDEKRGPIPILYENNNKIVFDLDLMVGINEEAREIMGKIRDIYYKNRIEHNLVNGEIIFIDNNRALHGRSAFQCNFDGNDRFLIRCFATFDYEKSNYAREGHMIKTKFS